MTDGSQSPCSVLCCFHALLDLELTLWCLEVFCLGTETIPSMLLPTIVAAILVFNLMR